MRIIEALVSVITPRLRSLTSLFFDDGHQTLSTWTAGRGVPLTSSTAEWNEYKATFGETSLFNAIQQAKEAGVTIGQQSINSIELPDGAVEIDGTTAKISAIGAECTVVDVGSPSPTLLYSATVNADPTANGYLTALPAIGGRAHFTVVHTPSGGTGTGYVWYQDAANYCAFSASGILTISSVGITCTALVPVTWSAGQQVSVRVTFGGALETIVETKVHTGAWTLVGVGEAIPSPVEALRTPRVARSWAGTLQTISVTNSRATPLYVTKPRLDKIQGTIAAGRLSQAYWDCDTESTTITLMARVDFVDASAKCGVRVNGTHVVSTPVTATGPTLVTVPNLTGRNRLRFTDSAKQNSAAPPPTYGAHGADAIAVYSDKPVEVVNPPQSRIQVIHFLGDSIIGGVGSSDVTSISKLAIIRYATNGEVIVHGIGGLTATATLGHAYTLAAAISEALHKSKSHRCWIALGTNDYAQNVLASTFGGYMLTLVLALHALAPNAQIYLQSPIARASEVANSAGSTLDDFRYELAVIANTRSTWIRYVHGLELTGATDGLHETDAGHATNAQIILNILAGAPPNMAAIIGATLIGDWVGDNMTLNGSDQVTAWTAQNAGPTLTSLAATHFATALDANGRRYLTNATVDGRRLQNSVLSAQPDECIIVGKYSGPINPTTYACAASSLGTRLLQATIGSTAWLSATGRKNGAAASAPLDGDLAVWAGESAAAPTANVLTIGNDGVEFTDRTWLGDIYSATCVSAALTAYKRMFVSASKRGFYKMV